MTSKQEQWLLLGLAVVFAVAMGGGKRPGSSKGAPGSARAKWDPLSIGKRKAAALGSGNPAEMRRMAGLFREAGYEAEALELEAAAIEVETRARQQGGGGRVVEVPP